METRALNLSNVLETRGLNPDRFSRKFAESLWSDTRRANGLNPNPAHLLTPPDANPKFAKTTEAALFGLALAPAELAGVNVCAFSTAGCRKVCLNMSGKGPMPRIQAVRVARTRFLVDHPDAFACLLVAELRAARRKYPKVAVRLNTFSDLRWELIAPWLFEQFADFQWADYTKYTRRTTPANYTLTFSASERTTAAMMAREAREHAVAVVFSTKKGQPLPETYQGLPVVDGDKTDARWLNGPGQIIGLRAKGLARADTSGFVRSPT